MKYIKTYEARSHPETNVDLTFEQYFNNILSKYSITDIFISFRSKDTLTDINPKNIWETPTGYYTFPLALYKNKIKPGITLEKFIKVFPVYWMKWSSEIKYVDFFILKDKTGIISSKTTTKELRKYIEKIIFEATHTVAANNKRSKSIRNKIWITDGNSNKRIDKTSIIPKQWFIGRSNFKTTFNQDRLELSSKLGLANSKEVMYEGIKYSSMKEASRSTGISTYLLKTLGAKFI